MKTIKILDNYYIRITGRNYIACELVKRLDKETNKETAVFVKPSYHVDFESTLQNIKKRIERVELEKPEIKTLKDAIDAIKGAQQKIKADNYSEHLSKENQQIINVEQIDLIEEELGDLE